MPSTLVNDFIVALSQSGIEYCHWKSNFSLAEAPEENVGADGDLDFLVSRKTLPAIQSLLLEYGFKPASVKWGPNPLSIYHHYGLDPATGDLVHVHLFSNVLTGESFVKSHLLPFERMLLENTVDMHGVKVVNRSAELVLFFVRTCIKYGSLLDVIYLQRQPDAVQKELAWLQAGSDHQEALALLRCYCPVIESTLFEEGLKTLAKPGALLEKIRLARQVRRCLRIYAKYTAWGRLAAYVQLLTQHGQRKLARQRRNKTFYAGGAVVALIGPEATGKSTLVAACKKWLGSAFAVHAIHAGKPPSTWLTWPLNGLLPLLRKTTPELRSTQVAEHLAVSKEEETSPKIERLSALVYAIRAVAMAWDRRNLLVKARRAAAQGELVICDRYPSEMIGAMDSPRLQADPSRPGMIPRVYNWLAGLEQRLYRQIPPPDVVIKLSVSLETAKQRNRDRIKADKAGDAYIESRQRQVRNWQRAGVKSIVEISTEQSLPETILCVKKAIWSSL